MNLYNHVARPGETPEDATRMFEQFQDEGSDMSIIATLGLLSMGIIVFGLGFILGAWIF